MPKKSNIDVPKLVEVIKKYDVYNKELKKIEGPGQACWAQIQNELNNTIQAKYIYTIVLQNRYGIAEKLNLKSEEVISVTTKNTYINTENVGSSSEEEKCKDLPSEEEKEESLNFNITLSPQEWSEMHEENSKIYKRSDGKNYKRSYETLKPYKWTPLINEHFFEQTKLPCCITYKYAKIYMDGQIFLDIVGNCTMCYSTLKGIVEHIPDESSRVIIHCVIKGHFKKCKSGKKRRVIGKERDAFLNNLINCNMSAAYIQRMEAKAKMNYGDKEPSHIPTLNALRVMKYKEQIKYHKHNDPILSVSILKGMSPYNTIIHDIGYDRFFLHYWASTEINSYRNYCKNTKYPIISIDATGGLVKKITLISGRETGNIFLYQIGVNDFKNRCQFTVAHMLSERHDNNSISHWLTEWSRNSITFPKIVVTDQSLALMMAVVKSFTQYSNLNKYISVCSNLIMNQSNGNEIPSCMLRNDFNHVMHLISSWPELKSTTFRIKNFYMRSVGLIIVSMDFKDVKNLLKHIFTVAFHETDGLDSNAEITECERSKQYLKQRIATHSIELDGTDNIDNTKDVINNDDMPYNEITNTTIFEEIKCIYDTCLENSKNEFNYMGDHDNMQFNPSIAKRLLDFCKLITCWSSLMVPIFKYGNTTESSSTSESLFKDIKSIIFKHKSLPLRLDDFIKIHINSIIGSTNMLASKIMHENQSYTNENLHSESKNSEECLSLPYRDDNQTEVENWKGLGYDIGKKKKNGTYLDKDPNVMFYDDSSRTKSKVIGILRNGNFIDLKSIKIDGKLYSVTNTCTFDSIFHIICTSYVDSDSYSKWINENIDNLFFELVNKAVKDGINTQTYKKRAIILKDVMADLKKPMDISGGIMVLDSSSTAYYLLEKLFWYYPSLQEEKQCKICQHRETRSNSTITVNLPTNNLNFLLDTLKITCEESKSSCIVCHSETSKTITANKHLIIEIILPMTDLNKQNANFDASMKLKEIPTTLNIFKNIYYLRGLINFIPPSSKSMDAVGRYVSFNWRETKNNWERYDDLLTSIRNVRPTSIVHNCQFIIYTV